MKYAFFTFKKFLNKICISNKDLVDNIDEKGAITK